jgi:hypothetical protein
VKLVFDETTGLSDIEIYDCNNGETVVESENGGLEQRLSSGAGASGDCLSQVRAAQGVQLHAHELVLSGYFEEQSKTYHCIQTSLQVAAMGSGDKRVIGLHIAVEEA